MFGGKGTSNRIEKLTHKRNQKVNDFMHKTSRLIVDYATTHQIGTIIIGKNDGWKQEINIGKKNNQSFVQIPFNKLIEQIEYKAEEVGNNSHSTRRKLYLKMQLFLTRNQWKSMIVM